ncbi:MAG: cytochrome c3 family protein, partial [Planctomycetota bacterium]
MIRLAPTSLGRRTAGLLLVVAVTTVVAPVPLRADEMCYECHADPADEAARVADEPLARPFSRKAYEASVHAKLSCDTCHESSGKDGFAVVPHRMKVATTCLSCHADDFDAIRRQTQASHHVVKLGERFACETCHDPHAVREPDSYADPLEGVRAANQACVDCHGNAAVYDAFAGEGVRPPDIRHPWLPSAGKHVTLMRCVVCHTPLNRKGIHTILPRKMGQRDCQGCHAETPEVAKKYLPPDDPRTWVTNAVLFDDAYVLGATKNRLVDRIVVGLFVLTVLAILVHALLRIVTGLRRRRGPVRVEQTYLYRASTRLWHGSNALLF